MKKIDNIIIHNSDSGWGTANVIRGWHKERGWTDIGYHFVILNGRPMSGTYFPFLDGSVETGRPLDGDGFISAKEVGAHALGYNDKSIGICLIGVRDFTPLQRQRLIAVVSQLMTGFGIPLQNVLGHYETERANGKTCPNIDMNALRRDIALFMGA